MMLLKDYDDGFTFFTILSNKGIELMENKNCSMNFWVEGNTSASENFLNM